MPRPRQPRPNAQHKLRAAIEAMERRILLSTITVDTFADQTNGPAGIISLRQAISMAASLTDNTSIKLPAGRYTLTQGDLSISKTSGNLTIESTGGTAILDFAEKYIVRNYDATVFLTGLTVTDAGGGYRGAIDNQGTLTLTRCAVISNNATSNGDAILNDFNATLLLLSSTVAGNDGPGIDNRGKATLIDSTISGNSGSGCFNFGSLHVFDSTIAENASGGIAGNDDPYAYSQNLLDCICANSIVAQNGGAGQPDVAGRVKSLGHNVVGKAETLSGWVASDQTGNFFAPLDARLSPLGNFGGPTATMVPLGGSPASGAGAVANVPKGISTDQRGLPRVVGGLVDAGAVQTHPRATIAIVPPAPQNFAPGKPATVSLGSFAAPKGAGPFLISVDWGDGSPDTSFTVASPGVSSHLHTFVAAGMLKAHIGITDRFGDLSNDATFTVAVAPAAPIHIIVSTPMDQTDPVGSKTISLRDAIRQADHALGPVLITFDPAVFATPQTILFKRSQLELGGNAFGAISIIGPAAGLTLSGDNLKVDSGISSSISGLTFTGGISYSSYYAGGAIVNLGALTLSHCTITQNSAQSAGGIENFGRMVISNSLISGNSAGGGPGGGILNLGQLALLDSTLSGNSTSTASGGGIYNGGDADITGCTITANHTSDALYAQYQTPYGGGIDNEGKLTLTNSTIVDNRSALLGGGIYNGGHATIYSSTITGNTGISGGVYSNSIATLVMANTIVADNPPLAGHDSSANDVGGNVDSLGHNLIGQTDATSNVWINTDIIGSVNHPIDPLLSPLDNYGGPTQTEFPLAGSPAIGAGSANLLPSGLSTDQRGFNRVVNGLLDIGAVELQRSGAISISPPPKQRVVAGNSASIQLGSFSDKGGSGPFSVIVNWGDGSANSYFTVPKTGTLGSISHSFTDVGALAGTMVVRDAAGNLSQPTPFAISAATHPPVSIVVNSTRDRIDPPGSGTVTLRDALNFADNSFGPVSILFDPKLFSVPQGIQLGLGTLSLTHNTFGLISLSANAGLIIRGNGNYRILDIGTGVSAFLGGVIITNGGGGIQNDGTLTLVRSLVSHNVNSDGGGIKNTGSVTLIDSTISGNQAPGTQGYKGSHGPGFGGGVYSTGSLTISGCSFTDNSAAYYGGYGGGDAILATGKLTITHSIFTGNDISSSADITIANSTMSGGGIDCSAFLQISNCAIVKGGGLYVKDADILDCTIAGNSSSGVEAGGTVNLTNCTIANNVNNFNNSAGGGVDASGDVTLINCTITGNSASLGGGVWGNVTVANTIIAGNFNSDGGSDPDVSGAVTSLGHNLVGQVGGSTGWISSDLIGTSAAPLDPRLSPLGHFGGPTPTIVPLAGSPALRAGSITLLPSGLSTDQRGKPRIVNGKVDIGAVQVQAFPRITIVGPADQVTIGATPLSVALGTLADPGGSGPFVVVLNWGDGSADTVFLLNSVGSLGTQTHVFSSLGTYHASFAATDRSGALSNRGTFNITVSLAPPASVVVNTIGDQTDPAGSKTVSLRDAIDFADHHYGAVSISFDPVVFAKAKTITLNGSQLELGGNIFAPITLTGPAAGVTISGNDKSGIFLIDPHVTAAFSGLTLVHGDNNFASRRGGAIDNLGNLTLVHCTIENNNTSVGGGAYNNGVLTIRQCFVNDNYAATGGGITNDNDGQLKIADSTISGNAGNYQEGGGLANFGIAYLTGCTLTHNTVRSNYSTGSFGSEGGAIANENQLSVTNCTITDNSALYDGYGGGIFNNSRAVIACSTITGNSGSVGGIDNESGASLLIFNTIVANNNSSNNTDADVAGAAQSSGNNLIGKTNGSSGWIKSDLTGTAAHPLDPKLSPLANHGGPTQTQIPVASSPAIGAGSVALIPKSITTDQRGKPRVVNGKVDVGAVEVQPNESH